MSSSSISKYVLVVTLLLLNQSLGEPVNKTEEHIEPPKKHPSTDAQAYLHRLKSLKPDQRSYSSDYGYSYKRDGSMDSYLVPPSSYSAPSDSSMDSGYPSYGAPPSSSYGAPPSSSYGAPPSMSYGPPAPMGYAAPSPPSSYGAPTNPPPMAYAPPPMNSYAPPPMMMVPPYMPYGMQQYKTPMGGGIGSFLPIAILIKAILVKIGVGIAIVIGAILFKSLQQMNMPTIINAPAPNARSANDVEDERPWSMKSVARLSQQVLLGIEEYERKANDGDDSCSLKYCCMFGLYVRDRYGSGSADIISAMSTLFPKKYQRFVDPFAKSLRKQSNSDMCQVYKCKAF